MKLISIQLYCSITDIPVDEWRQLCGASGFCDYGWLQVVNNFSNRSGDLRILVARESGRVAGAMLLEYVKNFDTEDKIARYLFGGRRFIRNSLGRLLVPNLVAGTPNGYGGYLLTANHVDVSHKPIVGRALVNAAEDLGSKLNTALWFPGVFHSDTLLLQTLRSAGYLSARYLPVCEMSVDWNSFDSYVADLKKRHKNIAKDIRRERNRCRVAGISFEEPTELFSRDSSYIALAKAAYAKHGTDELPIEAGFFASAKDRLGDDYLVCEALKSGKILGFVTMLSDGHTAWADSYGMDYTDRDSTFAYFNLVYQWPIQKSIELGLRRIVFGRGQYQLKMRRGCTLTNSYVLYKPSTRLTKAVFSRYFQTIDRHYSKQAALPLR